MLLLQLEGQRRDDRHLDVGVFDSVVVSVRLADWRSESLSFGYHVPSESSMRVFSIAQLGIMGWQMAAIKYEKDRAANTLLPNYNTYGKYDIPSYYESYWQSPEERYYTGLFVIQILCLISAFFLLFASVALIYGVHTWSRHLIWPWFICIVSSILTSLAYCIMWWAGDVRDYWMALTILEIIGVFINVYCVVVVYMFMQRLAATTDEYEGKKPQVRYKVNRNGYTRKPLDDYRVYEPIQRRLSEEFVKRPFPHYTTPVQQPYPMYSPSGMPQTPLPMPSSPYPAVPPYPVDDHERVRYDREPKARFPEKEDDPVAHWVKDQQKIALLSERGEAISEPISLSRPVRQDFPLQHSRSVPSLYDGGTLVSHRSCRHGKHRSSSKRRRRSRHANNSSDSESPIESTHDHRRRRRSRTRCSESEFTDATERWDRAEKCRRSRRSHSDHHNRDRDDRRRRKEKNGDDPCRRRHERDGYERNGRDEVIERISERRPRERRHEHKNGEVSKIDRPEKETSFDTVPTDSTFPLAGGISIPQHIVIPPSMGERGPDGLPLPQKFQINSEITINYDGMNPTPQSDANEPYRRRYPAVGVQSNV
ncbi:hypothetical protein GCK32_006690 [Trichostrongylus colubriformis]|uniref:Uncharacterized protein n=1 Tax=Trichostrongylus colubriformis TaxID=6319 RepID=A0AAN8FQB5_TRICO